MREFAILFSRYQQLEYEYRRLIYFEPQGVEAIERWVEEMRKIKIEMNDVINKLKQG